jgi:hypothetical protein
MRLVDGSAFLGSDDGLPAWQHLSQGFRVMHSKYSTSTQYIHTVNWTHWIGFPETPNSPTRRGTGSGRSNTGTWGWGPVRVRVVVRVPGSTSTSPGPVGSGKSSLRSILGHFDMAGSFGCHLKQTTDNSNQKKKKKKSQLLLQSPDHSRAAQDSTIACCFTFTDSLCLQLSFVPSHPRTLPLQHLMHLCDPAANHNKQPQPDISHFPFPAQPTQIPASPEARGAPWPALSSWKFTARWVVLRRRVGLRDNLEVY